MSDNRKSFYGKVTFWGSILATVLICGNAYYTFTHFESKLFIGIWVIVSSFLLFSLAYFDILGFIRFIISKLLKCNILTYCLIICVVGMLLSVIVAYVQTNKQTEYEQNTTEETSVTELYVNHSETTEVAETTTKKEEVTTKKEETTTKKTVIYNSGNVSGSGGSRRPYNGSSSGNKTTKSTTSKNETTTRKPSIVDKYHFAEDFYEDYYDDFYDFEDAEDYFRKHKYN